MGGEWIETTLGSALAFQRGHDLPEDARVAGSVPVIGSAGFTGWHNEARAKGPGITIGRSGASAGVISYVAQDYWPHNTCLYVTDFAENDPKFCFYWLGSLNIPRFNVGSAQPSLNRNHLYPLPVRIPQPREQRAIAETLSSLDDKIALNRRMAGTLEKIAQELFQSWFVNFDPVRRTLAGQSPGLPASVAALFPATFTGDLPEGWTIERVGDVFDIVAGNTPSTEQAQFWGDTYAWATPRDLSKLSGPILLNPERGLTEEGLRASSSGLLPAGTLLLSSRAPIGYLAFATRPTAINQGIAAFRKRHVSTSFAWMWCHTNMALIKASANGSTFLEISKGVLRQLPMVQGPEPVMRAFAEIADPLVSRLVALEEQNATLATLRDTLLPKLISGELRICNAETTAEDI